MADAPAPPPGYALVPPPPPGFSLVDSGGKPVERPSTAPLASALRGIPIAGAFTDKAFAPETVAGADRYEKENPGKAALTQMATGTLATAPLGAVPGVARVLGSVGNLTARTLAGGASNAAIGAADASARGKDPTTGAVLGGMGGVASPAIGSALAGTANKMGSFAGPSMDALFRSGDQAYQNARGLGVELQPGVRGWLANTLRGQLGPQLSNVVAGTTHRGIDQLERGVGPHNVTLDEIHNIRQLMTNIIRSNSGPNGNQVERNAARQTIENLDNYWTNIPPRHVAYEPVPGSAARIGPLLESARGDWGAARRSERVGDATERAELNAAGAGTGTNQGNALRQSAKSLSLNGGKTFGMTPAEVESIKDVPRGDPVGNTLRYFGKYSPSGPVSAVTTGVLAHEGGATLGQSAAIGAGAYVAKKMSDALTARRMALADEGIRMRSPLGQSQNWRGSLAGMLERYVPTAAPALTTEGNSVLNTPR